MDQNWAELHCRITLLEEKLDNCESRIVDFEHAVVKLEARQDEFGWMFFTKLRVANILFYLAALFFMCLFTFEEKRYTWGLLVSVFIYVFYTCYLIVANLNPESIVNLVSGCCRCKARWLKEKPIPIKWVNCYVTGIITTCATGAARIPFGEIQESAAIVFCCISLTFIGLFVLRWILLIAQDFWIFETRLYLAMSVLGREKQKKQEYDKKLAGIKEKIEIARNCKSSDHIYSAPKSALQSINEGLEEGEAM